LAVAALIAWAGTFWFAPASAHADKAAILADVAAFFRTSDGDRRREIVARIESDPAYDRAKVSEWLHQAELFEPLEPGRRPIEVRLPNGSTRTVVLRVPKGYDHRRPWPVIYALHGASGTADQIIGYLEHILGEQIEQYVVAAPDHYGDLIIHQPEWPPLGEHPAALVKIKQTVHADSDRVYLTGYSLGGHTTWTLAVLHADQFAAAMPLAGSFTLLLPDLMWESFLPNLAHLPILCVWGKGDIYDDGEQVRPDGGIAGVNRALRELMAKHNLPATMIELPDAGHKDVVPPSDELKKLLGRVREHYPKSVQHSFRHTYQGQAYWIEAHVWAGDQWADQKRTVRLREGESQFRDQDIDEAVARTYRGLLGEVRGEIAGQELRVYRKKVKELTVWIGDGMIDWKQPVVLVMSGRPAFEGRLEPNLHLALAQAARTWDFDRLRWAGLRFRSGGKVHPVTAETSFLSLAELLGSN
jgi:hypothetical protein